MQLFRSVDLKTPLFDPGTAARTRQGVASFPAGSAQCGICFAIGLEDTREISGLCYDT
jgi:hypothetical protein